MQKYRPWRSNTHSIHISTISQVRISYRTTPHYLRAPKTSTTMTQLGYAGGVAVAQLVFFVPFLVFTLITTFKHRKTSFAWFLLFVFCIIKIIGASTRIDAIYHPNNNTVWTIALICGVFGLNPLLMATLGVLSRAFYETEKEPWRKIYTGRLTTTVIHLPATAAVALCIWGATNADTAADIGKETGVKVGIILFTLIYLVIVAMSLVAWFVRSRTGEGEGLLIGAVLLALPFLAVRLLFGLLSIFDYKSSTFGIAHGSETAALCMEVLEEFIVVAIFVGAGWRTPAAKVRYNSANTRSVPHRRGGSDLPLVDSNGFTKPGTPVEQRR